MYLKPENPYRDQFRPANSEFKISKRSADTSSIETLGQGLSSERAGAVSLGMPMGANQGSWGASRIARLSLDLAEVPWDLGTLGTSGHRVL